MSYGYNFNQEDAKDRSIRRLKKENELAFWFNSFLIILLLIVLAISVFKVSILNNSLQKSENKVKQYQIYVDDVINTDEFKAVQKCKDGAGERWMAECIACELELRNAK